MNATCVRFCIRYRRTITRLVVYLTIAAGNELIRALLFLLDTDGLQIRYPSWIWWVAQLIGIIVACATVTRAMVDGSLEADKQNSQ